MDSTHFFILIFIPNETKPNRPNQEKENKKPRKIFDYIQINSIVLFGFRVNRDVYVNVSLDKEKATRRINRNNEVQMLLLES